MSQLDTVEWEGAKGIGHKTVIVSRGPFDAAVSMYHHALDVPGFEVYIFIFILIIYKTVFVSRGPFDAAFTNHAPPISFFLSFFFSFLSFSFLSSSYSFLYSLHIIILYTHYNSSHYIFSNIQYTHQ